METTVADLQALVVARYDRLDLPSWPDPRPDGGSPREEEYSRVTDPGRYRIVHERARAWAAVLAEVLGASVEEIVPSTGRDGRPEFDRGLRLTPQRPDALALLLLAKRSTPPSSRSSVGPSSSCRAGRGTPSGTRAGAAPAATDGDRSSTWPSTSADASPRGRRCTSRGTPRPSTGAPGWAERVLFSACCRREPQTVHRRRPSPLR